MWFAGLRKKTPVSELVPGKKSIIKGTIASDRNVVIPPSGTACVYYALFQEKYGKGARGSGRSLWFPEKMERRSVDFTVADDSGEITVRAEGDLFEVKGGHEELGAVKSKGKRRYSAAYLLPGDTVIVGGFILQEKGENGVVMTAPEGGVLDVTVTRKVAR